MIYIHGAAWYSFFIISPTRCLLRNQDSKVNLFETERKIFKKNFICLIVVMNTDKSWIKGTETKSGFPLSSHWNAWHDRGQIACQDLCLLPVCCSWACDDREMLSVWKSDHNYPGAQPPLKWQTAQAAPGTHEHNTKCGHQPPSARRPNSQDPVHLICTQRQQGDWLEDGWLR